MVRACSYRLSCLSRYEHECIMQVCFGSSSHNHCIMIDPASFPTTFSTSQYLNNCNSFCCTLYQHIHKSKSFRTSSICDHLLSYSKSSLRSPSFHNDRYLFSVVRNVLIRGLSNLQRSSTKPMGHSVEADTHFSRHIIRCF